MVKLSRTKIELFLDCPRCFWLVMNKKYLIAALIIGLFLSGCSSLPTKPYSFPKNTGTNYEYGSDNIPDVCFFPVKKARWDGYKVTNKNWDQLTDFQKTMFISEAADEIQRNENVTVDLKGGWLVLISLNKGVEEAEKSSSHIEFTMIRLMHDALKESGQIKPVVSQDKFVKNNPGNVRVSGDVTVSTINRKGF